MKGTLTPVVLLPRYTGYVGAGTYTTAPLNVEPYAKATVTLWRGRMPTPGLPPFKAYIEDSHDAQAWRILNAGGADPGAEGSTILRLDLERRWLRVRVVLTGTDTGVSCWAVGLLEERVDGA